MLKHPSHVQIGSLAAEHRLAENAVSIRNKYFYKFPSCGNCKLKGSYWTEALEVEAQIE